MEPTATAAHVISVLTMSAGATRRIMAAPTDAGHVHSVFDRALNILWHDGRLLTVHGPGPLLAPFAVALAHFPTCSARPGMGVRRSDDTIALGGLVLDWVDATTVETAMPEHPGDRAAVASLRAALPESRPSGGLTSAAGARATARLAEGARSQDVLAFLDGALALLGLGEGLTPSGDDCLVGTLAVIHRFARPWLSAHPEIASRIGGAVPAATTAIARDFVEHALAGHFAESLLDLMTAASAEPACRAAALLLRTGATSGADTLYGIRLALAALEDRGKARAWPP
jgi:hypothetical protein